jgi:hypothetical protein
MREYAVDVIQLGAGGVLLRLHDYHVVGHPGIKSLTG